jgi:hypothetical protein
MLAETILDLVACSDSLLDQERGALITRIGELERRVELHRAVFERLAEQLVVHP